MTLKDDYTELLTKREYFTAKAMQSLEPPKFFMYKNETEGSLKDWADKCVRVADAIIEALNRK